MDELNEILKRIKVQPLKGERVNSNNRAPEPNDREVSAIKETMLLLSDGQWHRSGYVRHIATRFRVTYSWICNTCGIAESDNGYYVCLAEKANDFESPDEKNRKRNHGKKS